MKTMILILLLAFGAIAEELKPFDDVLKLAKGGDLLSQGEVAMRYMSGEGVVQNYASSLLWAKHAANRGSATAQFVFGSLLSDGNGTPENKGSAFYWYTRAANQGNARAQYSLALMYLLDAEKRLTIAEGYKWFLIASAQQDSKTKDAFKKIASGYDARISKEQISEAQAAAARFTPKPEPKK